MKILAIDSTSTVAASAICEDDRVICEKAVLSGLKHSEILLPMIEKQLSESGLKVSDIDLFALSAGPGSFTGVRIGAATIKGLAFGGKKCVGVSSLEALAYNMVNTKGIICPVMDARRGQLYNAIFESDGQALTRLCDDRMISVDELCSELSSYTKDIYFTGDGYELVYNELESEYKKDTPEDKILQSAVSVALLALRDYKEGKAVSDRELKPIYLRLPQAERERLERENINNSNN